VPQTSTAEVCATLLVAQGARAGRPLPAVDSLLAATALAYGLTRVTRNTRDFEGIGATLVNPWNAP
jgi:predicted nucleic acid-binding protein